MNDLQFIPDLVMTREEFVLLMNSGDTFWRTTVKHGKPSGIAGPYRIRRIGMRQEFSPPTAERYAYFPSVQVTSSAGPQVFIIDEMYNHRAKLVATSEESARKAYEYYLNVYNNDDMWQFAAIENGLLNDEDKNI